MQTILITGCSSGFGFETARHFSDRNWTAVATMRTPREDLLQASERLRVLALDVTDADGITRAPVRLFPGEDALGVVDRRISRRSLRARGW